LKIDPSNFSKAKELSSSSVFSSNPKLDATIEQTQSPSGSGLGIIGKIPLRFNVTISGLMSSHEVERGQSVIMSGLGQTSR
jgi:hypothetical protein